ncbi:protease complex subunit PrcB family protein [Gudongella sp. SC589]|uniref:protease complex subunit PrcB family protein n=1 Tax=Gudongella sp. SC589 TaxID=3385990 RepID=UPI003904700A
MFRRLISVIMAFTLIFASGPAAFGAVAEKLEGHWSKSLISDEFTTRYFPYLAKEDFKGLSPDGSISRVDFTLSSASLFKDNGYTVDGIAAPGTLTRRGMADILGERLIQIGMRPAQDHQMPFGDVSSLQMETQNNLRLLHREGIINGESNSVFNPGRNLTQAEAIIVLQRTQSAIRDWRNISFMTLGVTQNYSNQEEVTTRVSENVVTLVVTKEFPTPGYTIRVDSIRREADHFRVDFIITPPDPGTIVPQVITYKTITIEIDRKELGEPPYDFSVEGFR